MTDLVQKIREALAKREFYKQPDTFGDVKRATFLIKFEKTAPQWLSEAAEEIERLTNLLGQSMAAHTIKDTTIATLREALGDKEVEWSSGPYRNKCPWCDGLYPTHRQDCKRQEVLG